MGGDVSERRRWDALRHVLWIGGPPDAGKSTVAVMLAERHGLQVYHFDRHEKDHIARADPKRHPALSALRRRLSDLEEREELDGRWVRRTPEEMARSTVASWSERVELAVQDLLAMPDERRVIAEGPGFFPERILPLIADKRQAVFLVPSETFKRASHERRGKAFGDEVSDPERATHNHIERDLLMAGHYRHAAREQNLILIEVDGAKSPEGVVTAVEAHFGPLLGGPA